MKKLILILLLFVYTASSGQKHQRNKVHINVDGNIANKYKDSLLLSRTNEVIVFQTNYQFSYIKSDDNILTFIIWKQNRNYFTTIISDSKIYSSVSFAGQSIFNFSRKELTYVTQDEDILKFTPPIVGNVIYFFSNSASNYYELTGKNNQPWTYVSKSKTKESIRQEYFNLIYTTLNNKLNLKNSKKYQRHF